MKRIVVKIGTNALTKENQTIDEQLLKKLTDQISKIREKHDILVVTSGAMGSGRSLVKLSRHDEITKRQILAVVGQVKLMATYSKLFSAHKLVVAQMLVTKDDFGNRVHYLNTKNCVESLFKEKIIPIMNENDFVAIEELMFTDNDELAGMIAKMINADKLIILTNVDGVLDKDKKTIKEFSCDADIPQNIISSEKSSFGKGGMQNKFKMAQDAAKNGTEVFIANSRVKDVILRIFKDENVGTRVVPCKM